MSRRGVTQTQAKSGEDLVQSKFRCGNDVERDQSGEELKGPDDSFVTSSSFNQSNDDKQESTKK